MAPGPRNFDPVRHEFKGSFGGGMSPNADILDRSNPVHLADAKNVIVSKPVGYLNSSALSRNVATTVPPSRVGSSLNTYNWASTSPLYTNPVWQKTIATFENFDWPSESWTMTGTGTGSLVSSISEGDQALSLANTAGQTATATCTLPSALDLSSPTYGILAVDTNWSSSNFTSGYIRIGSDSSNYRSYSLSSQTGNLVYKFTFASPTATIGSPTMSAIQYVQISVTASGGGALTVLFDNLRLGSFASATNATLTLTPSASNVYDVFALDDTISSFTRAMFVSGDCLFGQNSSASMSDGTSFLHETIKSGFTNTSPASGGTNFYFSQFPKTGSLNKNIFYYLNGSNGYFSYDRDASAGVQHVRIASTNYKYIASHKNMIFVAGASATPNTVQPSDINDPTTLTAANAVVVPNISGSYVTGLISMNEYLAILRNDGIYKLYGSDPTSASTDFSLIRSESKIGCIEQKAACRVGEFIYFFSGNGIYRFDGNDSVLISEGLENSLDGYNSKLCAMYYNSIRECVVFQYSPSTVPDPVTTPANHYELYYYPKLNSWGHSGGISDASSVKFFGMSWGGSLYSKPLVFEGGLQFYQLDPTTNTAYSMAWSATTEWNDAGTPDDDKDFAALTIYFRDKASLSTPVLTRLDIYTDYDYSTIKKSFITQSEIETITPSSAPASGTWTITYSGQTTASLAYNATAGQITTALDNLSNLVPGDIIATGTLATAVTLTFGGNLANISVDEVTVSNSTDATSLVVAVTQNGQSINPTNNMLELGLSDVVGSAIAFKISGTCTDQAASGVILSGYRGMYTYTVAP